MNHYSWDKKNGYKIEEATDTNKVIDELDQYVFVLRKKFDKEAVRLYNSQLTVLKYIKHD